uniref:CortBP2 domain-containing protein n=1 Tax=Elaeophora elaphi TaxID=1147741 RepID=A0A0R3RN25_9BILA
MDDESAVQSARKNFSTEELLRLLTYFEGEIQARDIVIAALKSERAKQLLHKAKYGQLAGSDPIKALQRDSSFADEGNEVDESSIGHMYETQLMQLERLITVQRRCHNRSKQW